MSSLVRSIVDGRYRVDALLGEGAVGAVYRAVDVSSDRVVALKQWSVSALNPEIRGRFLRETGALDTLLDHPNIVQVFGAGVVDDVPYMVLEYLEGQTLEKLIHERGALDLELALDIARQTLAAIAYAHRHNLVHRDIKPENIFLTPRDDGRFHVKVLDYGLAKFMAPTGDPTKDKTLTATGMVVGTPLYMPPEQATGVSVDLPVDVYAMGCTLFEMLTGRLPFDGETRAELLTAHMRDPVPKLSQLRGGLREAPALQAIIDRALAKKQTERYPNAGAMLAELKRIGAEPVARASATSQQVSSRRDQRPTTGGTHNSRLLLALGALVLAIVAVMFGLLL